MPDRRNLQCQESILDLKPKPNQKRFQDLKHKLVSKQFQKQFESKVKEGD